MISSSDIQNANILIVDDQEANVRLLDRMLRGAGYTSITSTMYPHEVCELHRTNRYDLILLDLRMPGMDGFQVMEGLKEIEKDGYLPVLVITAQPEHKLRALKAGAKDFVSKPLDIAEVLTRVYNMLEVRLLHLETKRLYDQVVAEQHDTEEARDRMDGILKSTSEGLVVTDIHNTIVSMNRASENLLNVHLSDVINRPIDFAINDTSLLIRIKETLTTEQDTGFYHVQHCTDEAGSRYLQAHVSVIRDKTGKMTGVVISFHDVTRDREIDRMKTEFISTAAHELRTPLTSILGFSEILLTRTDIGREESKKFLSYIYNQSKNLAGIINDLLDISRIESGKGFSLDLMDEDITAIIRDSAAVLIDRYPHFTFDLRLATDPVMMKVDKDKMLQVLENIMSNAIKYSPDGGTITVSGLAGDGVFTIAVADHGIGMTPDQVSRMFDKFYRADASNTAVEGTGLGMSIVKYLVEAHGGMVHVESNHGVGTTVTIDLPII